MEKTRKALIIAVLFIAAILGSNARAYAGASGCPASSASAIQILKESLTTLYNIFPIKIGGATIVPGGGVPGVKSVLSGSICGKSPVCVCKTPIPRIGLTVSFWEPVLDIETVKSPFCFPAFGVNLGNMLGQFFDPGKSHAGSGLRHVEAAQTHIINYPVFNIIQLVLTGDSCPDGLSGMLDIPYMSELDPTWRDDETSVIMNPESLLVANPIAQLACMVDSVATMVGHPIDELFWCMGDDGSVYPVAGEKGSQGVAQANMGLAQRALYKANTVPLDILWDTSTCGAQCGPLPISMWKKSQYGIFEAYPSLWPMKLPIGEVPEVWDHGMNMPIPLHDDNFDYFVYQNIVCCLG